MLRFRSTDPVHFAPGAAGMVRWMAYWLASRAANGSRALRERWHRRLRPALNERGHTLSARARTAFVNDTASRQQPYPSLSVAVREAQRGSRSGISATT